MMKDFYLCIPLVGEFYLEHRCSTRGSPFWVTAQHKGIWLFCLGSLCGGVSCLLLKKTVVEQ